MKKTVIITISIIIAAINISFSQKDFICKDSIVHIITRKKYSKILPFDIIKKNHCDILKILQLTDSIIKNNNYYYIHSRINFLYGNFCNSKIARDNGIRKKLLDSYIIMLEQKSEVSWFVLSNLLYNFKSREFNAEYKQRIKQLFPLITEGRLPRYFKLIGKLRINSYIPQMKEYLKNTNDEIDVITVTAALIMLNDKETVNHFINKIDKVSKLNKYDNDDIYQYLELVHYMSNRRVYEKLFDLTNSKTKIFIRHWSDEFGEGDTYWSIGLIASDILEENIKSYPKLKFNPNQEELSKEQKQIIKKWHRKNINYSFKSE